MNSQRVLKLGGTAVLLASMLPSIGGTGPANVLAAPNGQFPDKPPDTTAFQALWDRTDSLVASQQVTRSWFWGPAPFWTTRELYVDDPQGTGTRLVQYSGRQGAVAVYESGSHRGRRSESARGEQRGLDLANARARVERHAR